MVSHFQLSRYQCQNHHRCYHRSASKTTAAASVWAYTIPIIAAGGCADSNVLLETANLRHTVFAIIGTATEKCGDLPWKRSHKRPQFYLCLIIPVIPHHLK